MIIKKRTIKIIILAISSIISTHAIVRMHHQPEDQNATDSSRIAAQDDQPIPQQDTAVSEPPAAIAQEPAAQPALPEQQEVKEPESAAPEIAQEPAAQPAIPEQQEAKEPESAAPVAAITQEPTAQPALAEQQEAEEPESTSPAPEIAQEPVAQPALAQQEAEEPESAAPAPAIAQEPVAQPTLAEQQEAEEPESTSPAPEIVQEPVAQSALPEKLEMKKTESTFFAPAPKPAHKTSYTDSRYKYKSSSFSRRSAKQTAYIFSHADYRFEVKARGSAFIALSHMFRDVYGTAAGNVDVEFAAKLHKYLQVWANIDYTQTWGDALGFCDITSPNFCATTHIRIINGSAGLKAPFDINDWFRVYLGVGPTFGGIRIKGATIFTGCYSCSDCASSIGFVAKSGVDFFFCKRWFVDIFADYVYQKADFQKDLNASGLRVGAGLGVAF
jgi:opacity protein-like surface antigen